jgi:hypothetical protein
MESKITVNGVDYDSVESMPPEVKKIYDESLAATTEANRGGLGGLDVVLAENHTMQRHGGVRQSFFVNGRTYASEQDMPADVREQYEKAMAMLKSGQVTKNDVKLTFVVQGPHFRFGKSAGSESPSQPDSGSPPVPPTPAPIEPSNIGSGLRFLFAAVAFAAGGFVIWLLTRPR